ncbi:sensor N-terminal transmembrane domain-containing protein [Sandaracinobacter sp. RS1-74]|uniref:sensor histidine kinase n=1 Tax=Sandaracinobacteroides sayramensis TaxID=2913411 RepID=UPI001EDACAEA|nr:ATP-binding protein [Sandaracinobacteroides sayramensis]MCG2839978.1 sensor N-terminal transmembrane domain-containing protein [Sandaracinobacteroides sayramensis]
MLRARRRSGGAPRFSGWSSLVTRILVVNLLAILALAGALLYIESFRTRLLETREQELLRQGEIMAHFLENQGVEKGRPAILDLSSPRGTRIRLYDASGRLAADNWDNPETTRFELVDPTTEGFRRESAIVIDRVIDFITGQRELPPLDEPEDDRRGIWPEAEEAAITGAAVTRARQTRDRLVVLQAAVPVEIPGESRPFPVVLLTVDTPDVIDLVRRERMTSFLVFLSILGFSLALSLYLARIIVVPLRQLALAAHRVRLGRQRDVVVPRLPHRRDEIGGLARALADMTAALRQRIDATEAFAADVAHELKNPLASIRSAIEALGSVRDEKARAQLFGLIEEDVRRIDRLITDISAASRLDAELSRARLQPVDVGQLVEGLVAARTAAGPLCNGVGLFVEPVRKGEAVATADADRLAQVVNNLLDNAQSFSPEGGRIDVRVQRRGPIVEIRVEDEGPGVPQEARDAIFERFYSERPRHEDYGKHSGLGLSIARSIVEALDGQIRVGDRKDGRTGGAFLVTLPAI